MNEWKARMIRFAQALPDDLPQFYFLFMVGLARLEDGSGAVARVLADENAMQALESSPLAVRYIHEAIDEALACVKPPDDRPKGVTYTRYHLDVGGDECTRT